MTVVEKFLNVTEEWTRTSEQVKNEAVSNFKDPLNCASMRHDSTRHDAKSPAPGKRSQ